MTKNIELAANSAFIFSVIDEADFVFPEFLFS